MLLGLRGVFDLLDAFLCARLQFLDVLLAARLRRSDCSGRGVLRDLTDMPERLLPGLHDLRLDFVGDRTQPLVLNPCHGQRETYEKPHRDGADRKPERVFLRKPRRARCALTNVSTRRYRRAHL